MPIDLSRERRDLLAPAADPNIPSVVAPSLRDPFGAPSRARPIYSPHVWLWPQGEYVVATDADGQPVVIPRLVRRDLDLGVDGVTARRDVVTGALRWDIDGLRACCLRRRRTIIPWGAAGGYLRRDEGRADGAESYYSIFESVGPDGERYYAREAQARYVAWCQRLVAEGVIPAPSERDRERLAERLGEQLKVHDRGDGSPARVDNLTAQLAAIGGGA